ncbi:hypothetical protein NBRC116493_24130 [Aurantivibrio infirmus]
MKGEGCSIVVSGKFRTGYKKHFKEYSDAIRAYIEKHNGVVIRRQEILNTLYGKHSLDLFMLIEFPSQGLAEKLFFRQEYFDLIQLRDKIFSEFNMYLSPNQEI